MIFVVKSLDKDSKSVVKIYYSNKPWSKFKKTIDYYNRSSELLLEVEGGRALKKKIISKLINLRIEEDWFVYSDTLIDDIKNTIKYQPIKKNELLSLLRSSGRKNKKLKALCEYILINGDKSLQNNQIYLKDYKKIIDTLGVDKISSLDYRYNNCLNQII